MTTSTEEPGGVQKVAALLLSLEKGVAGEVLKHLHPDVLSEVAQAMTDLDDTLRSPQVVDEIWRELALRSSGPKELRPSGEAELGEMLRASVGPQRASDVLEGIRRRRQQEQPFAAIESAPPENLGAVLASESAAMAALVLAHISPTVSAAVLSGLEADRALDIVRRMSTLTPPGSETLQSIAADLEQRLAALGDGPVQTDPSQRLKTIADMLNFTGEEVERSVLEGLTEKDEDTAAEIREFMFTWEDIGSIDKRSMQKILGSVDTRTLSMSLKGASKGVEENVMANLSSRVRDMVREERELAGAVPMVEVQTARKEIMTTVRGLMDSGEFSPARSGEDLVS
jgi:flagellar motor switch protein FliG